MGFNAHEGLRFYLPILVLVALSVGLGCRLVKLHLGLVEQKPQTPVYEFNRFTQGRRGTIFSSLKLAFAKTTSEWEYRLDPVAALEKGPFSSRARATPHQRMVHMKTLAEKLHIPLAQVMDAYANLKNRYQFLATSDRQDVHDFLVAPSNRYFGLCVTEKQKRVYPQAHRLSHVVGFVNRDPENPTGGAGLELRYEKYLKGTRGQVHGLKDARGREERGMRDLDIDAQPGRNLILTIDHNVQLETERALREGLISNRAEKAWAVVMRVKTGAILAMTSLPDYDPGDFNGVKDDVRINRVISEVYEPGSVMKTITACAVLNEGRVLPSTLINTQRNDPNYYRLPGDVGHVWDEMMSVKDALVHSSNIVFGKLGFDLGPEKLYAYMTAMGLGRATGIELPGEEIGLLPPWKKWDKVKWSRAPIGQGVGVTALQMATAYAAIGNDGTLVRPYLVERIEEATGRAIFTHHVEVMGHPISPLVARQVRTMLTEVATKKGTARRAAVPGYTIAGKTGTAQMKEGKGYSSTSFNASFIGIVPATRPELVILVTYQKPAYCRSRATSESLQVPLFNHQGGICAAPTFKRIATQVLRYLSVEPDLPEELPEEFEEGL